MFEPLVCNCRGDIDCRQDHPSCTLCGIEAGWRDGGDLLCDDCAEKRKAERKRLDAEWTEEGLGAA